MSTIEKLQRLAAYMGGNAVDVWSGGWMNYPEKPEIAPKDLLDEVIAEMGLLSSVCVVSVEGREVARLAINQFTDGIVNDLARLYGAVECQYFRPGETIGGQIVALGARSLR